MRPKLTFQPFELGAVAQEGLFEGEHPRPFNFLIGNGNNEGDTTFVPLDTKVQN
jgi:hypothetical protein